MRTITDYPLIKRKAKIGKYLTFASLGVLLIGLLISFSPEGSVYPLAFLALAIGFLISQIGIYYTNRWGKVPRFDEIINSALKGLEDKYTLYHYTSPVSHLLVGPAGIWIIAPYSQKGTITYDEKSQRWKQQGGNWYLKVFAQEGIGRPDLDIQSMAEDYLRFDQKNLPDVELPEPQIALVFTNPKAIVQAQQAPISTLHVEKLKEFIRKRAKEKSIPLDSLQPLIEILPESSIE
jgi:hypothetical protein